MKSIKAFFRRYRFARTSKFMVRNLGPVGAIKKALLWSGTKR